MTVTFVEEYRTDDKSDWGPGPWQNEPDKAVWVDEATGLDCMIVRNRLGALCGYVGVAKSHPFSGVDYAECLDDGRGCEEFWQHRTPSRDLDVHGGLTYAGACFPDERGPGYGICHIEQPGRPTHVWWFGFDCAHAYDVVPQMVAADRRRYEEAKAAGDEEGMRIWGHRPDPDDQYRSIDYVVRQVEALARQLAEVSS